MGEYHRPIIIMKYPIMILEKNIPVYIFILLICFLISAKYFMFCATLSFES